MKYIPKDEADYKLMMDLLNPMLENRKLLNIDVTRSVDGHTEIDFAPVGNAMETIEGERVLILFEKGEQHGEIQTRTCYVRFVASGGDAGSTFEVECPVCGEKVQVAEYGWDDQKCSCGYQWSVDIVAHGIKNEINK